MTGADRRPLVLVTGAGGFVGGHVARRLAGQGAYRVRGLVRRPPTIRPGDPEIEWVSGELRDREIIRRAVSGARFVIHCASWVRLGYDPIGASRSVNVDATRVLLDEARSAGVERFVYTSTLQTLAAGPADRPASEDSPWNLDPVRSAYTETKREAERAVLGGHDGTMATMALCPGMAIGPRDEGPTSTRVLLAMSRSPVATLPGGGIPVIDVRTLALAHARSLDRGDPGRRYAVVGPYLSFRAMAEAVRSMTGHPRWVVPLPDFLAPASRSLAGVIDRLVGGRWHSISRATVAGGFLRFHVDGSRADLAFGLEHEPPARAIWESLDHARRSGHAPWLAHLASEPPPA